MFPSKFQEKQTSSVYEAKRDTGLFFAKQWSLCLLRWENTGDTCLCFTKHKSHLRPKRMRDVETIPVFVWNEISLTHNCQFQINCIYFILILGICFLINTLKKVISLCQVHTMNNIMHQICDQIILKYPLQPKLCTFWPSFAWLLTIRVLYFSLYFFHHTIACRRLWGIQQLGHIYHSE